MAIRNPVYHLSAQLDEPSCNNVTHCVRMVTHPSLGVGSKGNAENCNLWLPCLKSFIYTRD